MLISKKYLYPQGGKVKFIASDTGQPYINSERAIWYNGNYVLSEYDDISGNGVYYDNDNQNIRFTNEWKGRTVRFVDRNNEEYYDQDFTVTGAYDQEVTIYKKIWLQFIKSDSGTIYSSTNMDVYLNGVKVLSNADGITNPDMQYANQSFIFLQTNLYGSTLTFKDTTQAYRDVTYTITHDEYQEIFITPRDRILSSVLTWDITKSSATQDLDSWSFVYDSGGNQLGRVMYSDKGNDKTIGNAVLSLDLDDGVGGQDTGLSGGIETTSIKQWDNSYTLKFYIFNFSTKNKTSGVQLSNTDAKVTVSLLDNTPIIIDSNNAVQVPGSTADPTYKEYPLWHVFDYNYYTGIIVVNQMENRSLS